MKDTTTLILGGGFGGVSTANTLRRLLPLEHEIILVDKSPSFLVGATKTWVMLGERSPEQVQQSRSELLLPGIEELHDVVTCIDPTSGTVDTDLRTFEPDFLVIALGANLNMSLVPGLKAAAHTFYTLDGAVRLRQVLNEFIGGEVVLLIPRLPFKCPAGPYEGAILLRHYFNERGLESKARLAVYTMEGLPMATAGPEVGKLVRAELEKRGIPFNPLKKAVQVEPKDKSVLFEDGSQVRYDLLIAIPPHEAPEVVRQAGLVNQGGWIPVEPKTLRVTGIESRIPLYAIGDVAAIPLPGRHIPDVPLMLPKAGVLAEAQGVTVAHQIAVQILGNGEQVPFEGVGVCYIETGNEEAIKAEGHFFGMPRPVMYFGEEDQVSYLEKLDWVKGWMGEV